MPSLKTEISTAYWCNLEGREPAYFERAGLSMCWLDVLLRGGFNLQSSEGARNTPTTLLITGPPGGGKSTLALELCYRVAASDKFSLYISVEAETDQIIANARSLGWQTDGRIFPLTGTPPRRGAAIWGVERIEEWTDVDSIVRAALEALNTWFGESIPGGVAGEYAPLVRVDPATRRMRVEPNILVVDSLNSVSGENQGRLFQRFLQVVRQAETPPELVIFILDSASKEHNSNFWEYICDTVIRLDYSYLHEYYIRTIEILKARFQEHAWGKHQLKIYSRSEIEQDHGEESSEERLAFNRKMRRAHPYREEGGLFIFPSIHYHLSKCKRSSPIHDPLFAETLPEGFSKMLAGSPGAANRGLPEGRCTAFIGTRGGHKSHLGYLHLLHRIIKKGESGMVISLRDDEQITVRTMQKILNQEACFRDISDKDTILDRLEKENKLEILFFPPGYITPEEFFHRMLMSVYRIKAKARAGQEKAKLTLLFNSLDQLGARFPLCAKQEIFVPGMIEVLSGERVTSIFIAVEEPGQPAEQYGLLPMADLILSFHPYRFKIEDFHNHLRATWRAKGSRSGGSSTDLPTKGIKTEIVMQVVRFSGGQRAGAKGILELVNDPSGTLHPDPGLHFTRLDERFNQGINLSQPSLLIHDDSSR